MGNTVKSESFNFINHQVRDNFIKRVLEIPCDGKFKGTLSNAGSKSDTQRGLNWQWNNEVAKSGIGRFDNANDVHREGKLNYAIPILMAEEGSIFPHIFDRFRDLVDCSPVETGSDGNLKFNEQWAEFLDKYVRTENMTTAQVAEYMTAFQHQWISAGVNLTNPDMQGMKFR